MAHVSVYFLTGADISVMVDIWKLTWVAFCLIYVLSVGGSRILTLSFGSFGSHFIFLPDFFINSRIYHQIDHIADLLSKLIICYSYLNHRRTYPYKLYIMQCSQQGSIHYMFFKTMMFLCQEMNNRAYTFICAYLCANFYTTSNKTYIF